MKSLAPALPLLLASMLWPALARAQHDVPVWYLQYQVVMQSNFTVPPSPPEVPTTTTWTFDRVFSASATLDMRNEGAVITTTQAAIVDPDKFKNMSQAEMIKYSQDMLDAMQYTANWMPGPLDVGDAPDAMMTHIRSVSVPVRIHYETVTTGEDLPDEQGGTYDYSRTRTGSASGGTLYAGDQYKLEINSKSKKYWLVLPFGGQDFDPEARALKWETVEKIRHAGSTTWDETRSTSDGTIDWLPGDLKADDGSQWPVIEGTLAGPDRITGEKTIPAHFVDGPVTVPVTVTYRYTLTRTPRPATE